MAFIDYEEHSSLSLVGVRSSRIILKALKEKGLVADKDELESGYVYDHQIRAEILKRFNISFRGDVVGVVLSEKRKRNDSDGQNQEMSAVNVVKKIEAATSSILAFLDFLDIERMDVRLYFRAGSCAFGD